VPIGRSAYFLPSAYHQSCPVSDRIRRTARDRSSLAGVLVWMAGGLAAGLLARSAVVLNRWKERGRRGEGEPEPGQPNGDGDPEGAAASLAASASAREAVTSLFDALAPLPGIDAALLALVDEEGRRATGFATRGADPEWWRGISVDLEHDAGGIVTAARELNAFAVYDAESSPAINRRLASAVGAKSVAFVPLVAESRPVGVLVLVATAAKRLFSTDELAAAQRLANAAADAIVRTSSADALRRALEREKLVAEIARKVRSELDLDAVLEVAVSETGKAVGVARCFIRLGMPGEPMPVRAEWAAPGLARIDVEPSRLPVSNLAIREARTIAVGDVANATELDDPSLGGRDTLLALGSRSVLATPIAVFDEMIGVFALHRGETHAWSASEVSVAEAVAGEVGLAIHAARLLHDDARRLDQQAALLKAAQVVTSDLRLESVLRRLVDEVATLFGADAADCWMYDPGGLLRCRAVHGLPETELGRRITPLGTFERAVTTGEPVLRRDFAQTEDPPPSATYAAFEEVMVAPMTWLGEVRGVLGVGSREAGRFEASELELLDAFARFASLASHNAESFEERERQAQIQQGFYRIAEVLGSPLSLAETLDALAEAAAEALGGDSGVVLAPGGPGLVAAGSYGVAEALGEQLAAGLPAGATPFLAAAEEERIVSSTGLGEDERFDDATRALLADHGYCALLSAPVRRASGNVAVVVLFRAERTFSDDDLALARHLSRAARGALERSELFETERRARNLSERLATVGARLVMNLDPALVLDEVVREAPDLLEADGAVVRLFERDELVVRATAGAVAQSLVGARVSSGTGLVGDVAQSRRPATVEDARSTPQHGRGDPLLAEAMAACAAVPMVAHGGGLHGVLSVYGASPRAWRADEVQALVALAAMASAALSTAELYQRVAEEKERSDAILRNIADGIVAVDRDGRIVLWNSMAEQITGVPTAEALGRTVAEALQRELSSEDGEAAGEREVAVVRGGKEVWLAVTEAVMRDAAGSVMGRIFAFRDVSSERAVEQMKSDFVATVSHELRTPLTSIYGFAETLLREDVAFGDAERGTFLGYIASESERLIAIVDDLLNVARLEAGTLGLTIVPTNVGDVVRQALARFTAEGEIKHRFDVNVPDGLVVDADPARLAQVVFHLVDNAIKYSPSGGAVAVSGRRTADSVEVRVEDEGVGIPPTDRQRIFTKFVRGDGGPTAATQGTGVGLFLARGLLAGMRGRIWVESVESQGSAFVFELPVSNGSAAGMEADEAAPAAAHRPNR
jgi:two-component system, OmpR family, phosphate regulon sensor histidine kinase PhoR